MRVLERQRFLHKFEVAESFHRRLLLSAFGMRPWRSLLVRSRAGHLEAEEHFRRRLTAKCLGAWSNVIAAFKVEKRVAADCLRRRTLLAGPMEAWMKVLHLALSRHS